MIRHDFSSQLGGEKHVSFSWLFEPEAENLVVVRGDADKPHRFEALDGRDAETLVVACSVPYLLLKSYL